MLTSGQEDVRSEQGTKRRGWREEFVVASK